MYLSPRMVRVVSLIFLSGTRSPLTSSSAITQVPWRRSSSFLASSFGLSAARVRTAARKHRAIAFIAHLPEGASSDSVQDEDGRRPQQGGDETGESDHRQHQRPAARPVVERIEVGRLREEVGDAREQHQQAKAEGEDDLMPGRHAEALE